MKSSQPDILGLSDQPKLQLQPVISVKKSYTTLQKIAGCSHNIGCSNVTDQTSKSFVTLLKIAGCGHNFGCSNVTDQTSKVLCDLSEDSRLWPQLWLLQCYRPTDQTSKFYTTLQKIVGFSHNIGCSDKPSMSR